MINVIPQNEIHLMFLKFLEIYNIVYLYLNLLKHMQLL